MKRTARPCHNCKEIFILNNHIINGHFCKICRNKIKDKAELKLYEYLQIKYNNKLLEI